MNFKYWVVLLDEDAEIDIAYPCCFDGFVPEIGVNVGVKKVADLVVKNQKRQYPHLSYTAVPIIMVTK